MEQIISPGQGLLLLMDYYESNRPRYNQLVKYYLLGPSDLVEYNRIINELYHPILNDYTIDFSPHTITDDPTRRYFETHLAYWTLINGLDEFDSRELVMHNRTLEDLIEDSDLSLDWIKSNVPEEYSLFFQGLADHSFIPDLTMNQRDKLSELVQSVILGLAVASSYDEILPINIYSLDFFEEEQRGREYRIDKSGDHTKYIYRILTQNWGLLKSLTPLGRDDIALSEKKINYLKPSDMSIFKEDAAWVHYNFNRLVHPFSNSISGTMLVQLRVLAGIKQHGLKDPLLLKIDSLSSYFKLMTSAMILHSGGHSYFEFLTPIMLDPVRKEFRDLPGFKLLNMESMLYTGNEPAVENAILESRAYNRITLLRGKLMTTIKARTPERVAIVVGLRQLSGYLNDAYNTWLQRTVRLSDRRLMIHERLAVALLERHMQNADNDDDLLTCMYEFLTNPQRTTSENLIFFSFLVEQNSVAGLTDLNVYIEELKTIAVHRNSASPG